MDCIHSQKYFCRNENDLKYHHPKVVNDAIRMHVEKIELEFRSRGACLRNFYTLENESIIFANKKVRSGLKDMVINFEKC